MYFLIRLKGDSCFKNFPWTLLTEITVLQMIAKKRTIFYEISVKMYDFFSRPQGYCDAYVFTFLCSRGREGFIQKGTLL